MAKDIKDKLFNSALELITQYGFHGASMKMIVDKAGVSNGGAFYHFKTKEQLINELHLKIKEQYAEAVSKPVTEDMSIRSLVKTFWVNRIYWSVENNAEKRFLEMYRLSPYNGDKNRKIAISKISYFLNRVQNAMSNELFISIDIDFFLMELDLNSETVYRYILSKGLKPSEVDLDFFFSRYWRSIILI